MSVFKDKWEGKHLSYAEDDEKDKKAWDYLRQRHYACVLEEPERVYLRGKVRVTTHRDDGSIIEDVVLCAEEGRYDSQRCTLWLFVFLCTVERSRRMFERIGVM